MNHRGSLCTLCNGLVELDIHILGNCSHVQSIWRRLAPLHDIPGFFTSSGPEWIVTNLSSSMLVADGVSWPSFFGCLLSIKLFFAMFSSIWKT